MVCVNSHVGWVSFHSTDLLSHISPMRIISQTFRVSRMRDVQRLQTRLPTSGKLQQAGRKKRVALVGCTRLLGGAIR